MSAVIGRGTAAPLFSPSFIQDPYPTYREHLAGPPIQALSIPGRYAVFHYDACAAVAHHPKLSVAQRVQHLFAMPESERVQFDDLAAHIGSWILMKDPPEHGALRKWLNLGFSPTVIDKLKPRIVRITGDLLDKLEKTSGPDFIRDLAKPLPVRVISDLLGVHESLHGCCVELSDAFSAWFADPLRTAAGARIAQAATRELVTIFKETISGRGDGRAGDLLDLLLDIAREQHLAPEELHAQCVLLLIAGHETTRNLIGNGLYTLLKNPTALAEVRANESAIRPAIEEVLRYESPVQGFTRGSIDEIVFEGVKIPAGAAVYFMVGAAHRDPRRIPDPDRFDIHRPHNRHLGFGTDAHVCLGSTLARLEGQVAIAQAARRFPALALIDDAPIWSPVFGFRGLTSLPIRW